MREFSVAFPRAAMRSLRAGGAGARYPADDLRRDAAETAVNFLLR